jgi:esterase/lipase
MARKIIDRVKVKELRDQGTSVTEIAAQMGCTKGTISKILKEMGSTVAKAAVVAAPKYIKRKDAVKEHLLSLARKAQEELRWIEQTVPPTTDADYREWQNQKLKFAAELRKIITTIVDIGYKLYHTNEVLETIEIIDAEIGRESEECQRRIRERLNRRLDIRIPVQLN